MRIKLIKKKTGKGGYFTYQVSLPKGLIDSIGWKDLDELELEARPEEGEIVLVLRKPRKQPE